MELIISIDLIFTKFNYLNTYFDANCWETDTKFSHFMYVFSTCLHAYVCMCSAEASFDCLAVLTCSFVIMGALAVFDQEACASVCRCWRLHDAGSESDCDLSSDSLLSCAWRCNCLIDSVAVALCRGESACRKSGILGVCWWRSYWHYVDDCWQGMPRLEWILLSWCFCMFLLYNDFTAMLILSVV